MKLKYLMKKKSTNCKNLILILLLLFTISNSLQLLAQTDISSTYTFKPMKLSGGGFVTGFAAHPSGNNVLYCRTDVGGVHKWDNANSIWVPLFTYARMPFLTSIADWGGPGTGRTGSLSSLAIGLDPNNAQVIYIVGGAGLIKSTNGGGTFSLLPNFNVQVNGNDQSADRTSGERLAIDPGNSNNMLFGSQYSGMWRSTNAGVDWYQVDNSQIPTANTQGGVEWIQYAGSGVAYASVKNNGIYKTTNGGANWTNIYGGGVTSADGQVVNGVLYAAIYGAGVQKYNGSSWTSTNCPDNSIDDIAVDPTDNTRVYAIRSGYYMYRLSGGSWTSLNRNMYAAAGWKNTSFNINGEYISVGDITIDPSDHSKLWMAEGMGMWRASIADNNNSPQFQDISNGIEEFVGTDIASSHNGKVTVAVWDRQGFTFSNPDNVPSNQAGYNSMFSSSMSVDANPTNPDFVTMCVSDFGRWGCCGENSFSTYSNNAGTNWTKFGSIDANGHLSYNGTTDATQILYAGEIVSSANNTSNMVWIPRKGADLIYYSNDAGTTWNKSNISSNWSGPNAQYLGARKILTADAVTQGKFYTYSSWNGGTSYVSTDGGANWTPAGNIPPYNAYHLQIKHAPGKAGHVWFCSGFDYREPNAPHGLFNTTNSASTWNQVAGVQECWGVGFGATAPNASYPTIYIYGLVNNQWGVFRSTDQAANWSKLVDFPLGNPDVITAIEGDVDDWQKVYLAFQGTGFAYGKTTSVINVSSVNIIPTTLSLPTGTSNTLSFSITPSTATDQTVTWTSANPSIATVNSSGLVTGVSAGTTTVTVKTNDGGKTDICTVTVTANTGKTRLEAESANSIVGPYVSNNTSASNGAVLGGFDNTGNYIQWTNVPASDNISVTYYNQYAGTRTLYINGTSVGKINFTQSNNYAFTTVQKAVSIPAGATVKIQRDADDTQWVDIDFIEVWKNSANRYEAESATLFGPFVSNYTGASGGKVVGGFDNTGNYLEWQNVVAGTSVKVAYYNAAAGTRSLYVNGNLISGKMNFPLSNSITTMIYNVNIPAGATIKIQRNSDDNQWLDIDYIEVISSSSGSRESAAHVKNGSASIRQGALEPSPSLELITVYPNPSKGLVNISSENDQIEIVQLSNSIGQALVIQPVSGSSSVSTIDISALPIGLYFVKVKSKSGLKVFKVVKE